MQDKTERGEGKRNMQINDQALAVSSFAASSNSGMGWEWRPGVPILRA